MPVFSAKADPPRSNTAMVLVSYIDQLALSSRATNAVPAVSQTETNNAKQIQAFLLGQINSLSDRARGVTST